MKMRFICGFDLVNPVFSQRSAFVRVPRAPVPSTVRRATDTSVGTQIAERIANELPENEFNTLFAPASVRRGIRDGFSIIEMTLALGVASFAFVSLCALLPLGLNTFRQSMEHSVGSNIAQLLINEAQQTDFNTLTADSGAGKPVRYFDEQGSERPRAQDPSVIYHVNTQVLETTKYPGTTTSNASVATVTVQVAYNPGNLALTFRPGTRLWDLTNRQPIAHYPVLVPRTK